MSLSQELEQTLLPETRLTLNGQMIASLEILQLSAQELSQAVSQRMLDNPLLDIDEAETCPACGAALEAGHCLECGNAPVESSWSHDDGWDDGEYSAPDSWSGAAEDCDAMALLAGEASLAERLEVQLRLVLDEEDMPTAQYALGLLDDRGFMTASDREIALACGVTVERVSRVMAALRDQEPSGVGARSPRECLSIQLRHLRERGEGHPLAERVIEKCFEELGQHKFAVIASHLGVTMDDIADCLDYIKTRLTPYPFEVAQVPTGRVRPPAERIRPDVAFIRTEDGYRVQLIERGRYRLGLNPHYVGESNAASLSPSDRQFMRRCLVDAKIFVRAIEQRWTTLQAISECIGEFQREFLDEGVRQLKPLTRGEVAQRIGVHESTVSRAVDGKYVMLPDRSVISFDDLFDSSLAVKSHIRALVKAEDPSRPLSDETIAERLRERGHFIARRTVAKYRDADRILSSQLRGGVPRRAA